MDPRINQHPEKCNRTNRLLFSGPTRGYYAHLHELGNMKKKGLDEYKEYRTKLLSELQAAEKNGALTHQMQVVFEYLNRGDDTD
jgi:hypothetical protein